MLLRKRYFVLFVWLSNLDLALDFPFLNVPHPLRKRTFSQVTLAHPRATPVLSPLQIQFSHLLCSAVYLQPQFGSMPASVCLRSHYYLTTQNGHPPLPVQPRNWQRLWNFSLPSPFGHVSSPLSHLSHPSLLRKF